MRSYVVWTIDHFDRLGNFLEMKTVDVMRSQYGLSTISSKLGHAVDIIYLGKISE